MMMFRWRREAFRRFCLWSRGPVCARTRHTRLYNTSPPPVTVVERLISESIRAGGPIPVSEYTQLCLSHPTEGYYTKKRSDGTDVFGVKGDFVTSPEISQVFGELIGIWLLSRWLRPSNGALRKPKFRLIELGPGRGTLMDDIIRTLFNWPEIKAALASVHLVETSPAMVSLQQDKLSHWFHSASNVQLHTHASLEDVPSEFDQFSMIIAHEFFDALPAHILEKTSDAFREVLVDLHPCDNASEDSAAAPTHSPRFRFVLSPTSTARSELLGSLSPRFAQLPPGTRLEVSSAGWRTARKMSELISPSMMAHNGELKYEVESQSESPSGAGLIIDYGDEYVFGSSFRAFKNHNLVDVFETPGMCDLTMNVDFALLKEACKDIATTHGPLPQSEFLLRMGVLERLAALTKQATSVDRGRELHKGINRLIDRSSQGMGNVYRVLGLTSLPKASNDQVWPFVD